MTVTGAPARQASTVPLDWSEVYYTNCPLVSASNVNQELGRTREEYEKIGVEYAFLRSRRENNSWVRAAASRWRRACRAGAPAAGCP